MNQKRILITGCAGFIAFHVAKEFINNGDKVIGIDNINDYYDINLKEARLKELGINVGEIIPEIESTSIKHNNFRFIKADLAKHEYVVNMMLSYKFEIVIHLAAQPGVRYSLVNPRAYTSSNIDAFLSVLEGARQSKVAHFLYASTSSVYGLNTLMPFKEDYSTEHQISLYAATKKANEMMAHTYSHLFGLATTGLRFFTVYGPWGRPDMALFLFTKSILEKRPIQVFNNGKMVRDFTYISDVVESIKRLSLLPPKANLNWDSNLPKSSNSSAPYQIFNIGNSNPEPLTKYIDALEKSLGSFAIKEFIPIQPGDVPSTHADISKLENYIGFKPETSVEEGVEKFTLWYKDFYKTID